MAAWRSTCWAGSPCDATAVLSRRGVRRPAGAPAGPDPRGRARARGVPGRADRGAVGRAASGRPGTNLNVVVNRARRALGEPDLIQTTGSGYLLSDGTDVVVDLERFEEYVGQARAARTRGDHGTAAGRAQARWSCGTSLFPRTRTPTGHARTGTGSNGSTRTRWRSARTRCCHRERPRGGLPGSGGGGPSAAARGCAPAAGPGARGRGRSGRGRRGLPRPATDARRRARHRPVRRGGVPLRAAAARDVAGRARSPRGRDLVPTYRPWSAATGNSPNCSPSARPSGSPSSPAAPARGSPISSTRSAAGASRPVLLARSRPARTRGTLEPRAGTDADPAGDRGRLARAPRSNHDRRPGRRVARSRGRWPRGRPASRRALVQQGLLRVLESTGPSLVVVDDLQWADSSSLDLLALLAGRSPDVAMVVAYRPEEVAEDSPGCPVPDRCRGDPTPRRAARAARRHSPRAPGLLAGRRSRARRAHRRDAVRGAAGHAQPRGRGPAAAQRRGRLGRGRGALPRSGARVGPCGPARRGVAPVRAPPPRCTSDCLAALSLLARPVPVRILSAVCGMSVDEAIRLLRDLSRNHLVRHDTEGFRVDHDLVGETVRDRLDAVERAALHQRIADALAVDDGPVDELARHLAGAGDTAAAASAYATAARARVERFARPRGRAAGLRGTGARPAPGVRAALLEVRAETLAREGRLRGCPRRPATCSLATTPGPTRSRLLTRLAHLTFGADDLLRALRARRPGARRGR